MRNVLMLLFNLMLFVTLKAEPLTSVAQDSIKKLTEPDQEAMLAKLQITSLR